MSDSTADRPNALVEALVQSRNHYKLLIKEIDSELIELSKKYELAIRLD